MSKNKLEVHDLSDEFKAGFSDAFLNLPKCYQTVYQYNLETSPIDHGDEFSDSEVGYERRLALVKVIGRNDSLKYRVNSVKKIVDVLNDLADKGYIKAMLAPLSGVPMPDGTYTIVSYPALEDEGIKYLEETYPEFQLPLEDFDVISEK